MKILLLIACCLTLAACPAVNFSGGGGDDRLEAPDAAYDLALPDGWKVAQRTQSETGRVMVLVHKDAAATGTGYPTMIVREVREVTPQGVLEIMSRDQGLLLTELWNVSPEKYQLKQALLDRTSQVLGYWLVPRDGQGLEYYGAIRLTAFGRLEMIGLAQAGKAQGYLQDFNAMFQALRIGDKARFDPARGGDTPGALRAVYVRAVNREQAALARQGEETAAWARSASGLNAQERRFLEGAYVTAVNRGLSAGAELAQALARPRSKELAGQVARLAERLDETGTALETIQLNIREPQARASVEKSAAKARRLAGLARESLRLPLE